MKKYFYLAAVSAMMLTACSSENDVVQPTTAQPTNPVAVQQQAVAFDTYLSSSTASTRAGESGVMTTEKLKTNTPAAVGFGVMAFYTDNVNYTSGLTPNFMYNEHVSWDNGWTYSPLKYWPNETTNDSQTAPYQATASTKDKLSFFAYAPYVNLTTDGDMVTDFAANSAASATGKTDAYTEASPTTGILALTKEDYTGDPLVEYAVSKNPDNNVDLLWGVAPAGMSYTDVSGSTTTAPVGTPLKDMVKPDKDQKMKFLFQHALSRIGLTVVSAIDQIAAGDDGGIYTKADTRVLIEEVIIWGEFGTRGVLNLNNGTKNVANWIEASVNRTWSTEASPLFTVKTANDYLADDLRYVAADVAAVGGDESKFADLNEGVLPSEKTLLKADGSSNPRYFMVIPSPLPAVQTGLYVQIKYHVITKDTKLTGNVSNITNTITRRADIHFENGKSYNLKLILGLTSVKLDATVADWQVADDSDIWLPQNVQP